MNNSNPCPFNFFFGNPGPYSIDFRFQTNIAPAGFGFTQMPQNQQHPALHYPYPNQQSSYYSFQGQSQGHPCKKHQSVFCVLPECRTSNLEESSASSVSVGGGGVASDSWSYTTPQDTSFGTPQQFGSSMSNSSYMSPTGGGGFRNSTPFRPNQKYEKLGDPVGSWNTPGGGGQSSSFSTPESSGCFSPTSKRCNIS